MAEIRIGTSGWAYKHWQNRFYPPDIPQKNWLNFYSHEFDTIEINSTFYRLPQKMRFEKWSGQVPDDFLFAVKASRYITHVKRLKIDVQPIDRLVGMATGLSNKLGPVLFQLPPNLKFDRARLQSFLDKLPSDHRHVLEPRHQSWLNDEVFALLKDYNVCLCFVSSPDFPSIKAITSDFIFLRMHGSKMLYGSSYTDKELETWAQEINIWSNAGLDCFVYFNNDALAYAVKNARTLKELINNKL